MKRKARLAGLVLLQDFGAQDVGGHQVGRELDAAGVEAENGAHRVDELGLGEAGHADEQPVAAGQHRDQRPLHHDLLAEDDAADAAARSQRFGQRLSASPTMALALTAAVLDALMLMPSRSRVGRTQARPAHALALTVQRSSRT